MKEVGNIHLPKASLKNSLILAVLPIALIGGLALAPHASANQVHRPAIHRVTVYNAYFDHDHLIFRNNHQPMRTNSARSTHYTRHIHHYIRPAIHYYNYQPRKRIYHPQIHVLRPQRRHYHYIRRIKRTAKPRARKPAIRYYHKSYKKHTRKHYIRPVRRRRKRVVKHIVRRAYDPTGNTLTHHDLTNLFNLANTNLGKPYAYGATGPNSYDCSGFTQYLYNNALHKSLSRSAQDQYDESVHIAPSQRKPGDLIFFGYSPYNISHVGIYQGKDNTGTDKMYDAQLNGVESEPIYRPWWNYIIGYGVPYSISQVYHR